jgi:hypothetical protein
MSDEKKFPPADPSPQHLLGLPPLSAFPYVESLDRPFDEKQFAVDMTMALEAKNAPVHPPFTSEAFKKAFAAMKDRRRPSGHIVMPVSVAAAARMDVNALPVVAVDFGDVTEEEAKTSRVVEIINGKAQISVPIFPKETDK